MKIKRNIRNVAIVLLIMFVCIKCVSCMAWSENYTYDLQSIDNEGNYVSYRLILRRITTKLSMYAMETDYTH